MGKKSYIYFLLLVFSAGSLSAQEVTRTDPPKRIAADPVKEEYEAGIGWDMVEGEAITTVNMPPIPIFAKKKDFRQYQRTVRAVKKVYPYAKEAGEYMAYLEAELPKLKTDKEKEKFTKKVEKEIIKKYTPVLEKMTRTEGRVLIKLIDRETRMTTFEILKEFRGGFSAGFWNTIAKLFKADLKDTYDAEGEDKLIEQIIKYYEAGLL